MVVLNALTRPKKLFLLLPISLFAGIFVIFHTKHHVNDVPVDIPSIIGATLPDLDQLEYLPESAVPCSSKTPNLLAFVHSSPTHIPHRDAIRKTWGSAADDIKTIFFVGRSKNEKVWQRIQQEAREYGDMVLLQLVDSYKNLTLKHLSAMRWVITNCPHTPYVLKADDDTFVDTKRLLSILYIFLGDISGSKDSLICHVMPEGTSPKRSGKWMVTQEEYPYEEYPEYCSGLAYFARMSTVRKMSDVALSGGVPYLRIDDVYVTGLSATLAGVKRQDLGVRFATNEQPVIEWMLSKSLRPCPWMVAEMSSYYWPKEAFNLWNKTVLSWKKFGEQDISRKSQFEFQKNN